MFKPLRFIALAGLCAVALPSMALAQDLKFTLIKKSGITLSKLYVTPSHQEDWGGDILGRDVLPSGESGVVTIADGERTCSYDMRFVSDEDDEMKRSTSASCASTR